MDKMGLTFKPYVPYFWRLEQVRARSALFSNDLYVLHVILLMCPAVDEWDSSNY